MPYIKLPFNDLNYLLLIPFLIFFLVEIVVYLNYINFYFIVNDRQIEVYQGILNKNQTIIPLDNINNIQIISDIFFRILGLAKVEVWTAAHSQMETKIMNLPDSVIIMTGKDAEEFKDLIMKTA